MKCAMNPLITESIESMNAMVPKCLPRSKSPCLDTDVDCVVWCERERVIKL